MSRLWSTAMWDWRLQWRQGIFLVAALILVVWGALFSQVDSELLPYLLPPALYLDLSIFGFYFMAGLLYLEKGEGVLAALVVTPMRSWHYLAAKIVTLALLGLVMSLLFAGVLQHNAVNWVVNWPILATGVLMNGTLFVLASFLLAVRYDAINEFLLPSIAVLALAQVPLVDFYGLWSGWPLYLLPFQASLLLIRAAFEPLPAWQWVYALGYVTLSIGAGFWWSLRSFEHFVTRSAGGAA